MLRDGYNVQFEGTIVRTAQEPTLLRENNVQRDQGWSWIVLFAAFLTLFITNGMHASFGILYSALISHFDSGREETAWIGSISLGLLCFFSPVASVLIEQIGCRATSIIGAFLCSLGFLITSFATGIALLYFSHGLLFGLGTSLTYTAAMTVVTRSFERRRNIATGVCASGSQFGGISLAPLSQVLFDRLGYANTFRTFSGLLLLVAISSLVYRSEINKTASEKTSTKKSPKEMLNVWKSKPYIVWALGTTMVTLGYNIPRYTLAKYASDQGISKDASAWLVSYLCASSAIGRITFGRLCEWVPKLYLCQACIIGCAFSAFLYPFLNSYLSLVITAIIFGLPDGGFVASLAVVTTEIVGPEKMVEGFGFMLFCQSYSNVIGPPLSGMLYDTYQSYKAAFCFAAVPEIIGALMLFLIPYYRRNQVRYTHEIDYGSNSGMILNDNGAASTLNPISEVPILAQTEPQAEYNVVINLTSDNPDVRLVNVMIQKTGCNETTGVTCNDGETSNKAEGETELPACVGQMPLCTSTIATEGSTTIEQPMVEPRVTSAVLGNESEPNILCVLNPMKSSSTQTVIHDCNVEINNTNNSAQTVNEDNIFSTVLTSKTSTATSSLEDESKIIDVEISAPVSLEPSTSVVRVASNTTTIPDPRDTLVEEIVQLHTDQDVPKISPPPQRKHHVNSTKTELHLVTNADVSLDCHDSSSPETMLAELDTFIQGNELPNKSCIPNSFATDVEIQETSIMKSPVLDPGFTGLQSALAGLEPTLEKLIPESVVAQNQESLMLSTSLIPEVTSPCLSTAFSTEPSQMSGINDVLTQKQLPEPLQPTSLSSVRENEQNISQTPDIPPATSPLSCELSTVIADVIQSLTSHQSTSQKSTKESNISSNMHDNLKENSDFMQHPEKEAKVLENTTVVEPKIGVNVEPSNQTSNELRSYYKLQTSVLRSMQSIVAEGCPEDVALLEDISIDLTLDKDPSFASVVVIDDIDEQNNISNLNLSCMPQEPTVLQTNIVSEHEQQQFARDPINEQSMMTSTTISINQSPGGAETQTSKITDEGQRFLGSGNDSSIKLHVFSSELSQDRRSTCSNMNQPYTSEILTQTQHTEKHTSLTHEATVPSNIVSSQPAHEPTCTNSNVTCIQELFPVNGQSTEPTLSEKHYFTTLENDHGIVQPPVASNQQQSHESTQDYQITNTQPNATSTPEIKFPNIATEPTAIFSTAVSTQPFQPLKDELNIVDVSGKTDVDAIVVELFPTGNDNAIFDETTLCSIKSHEKFTKPIESTNPFY